MKPDRPPIGGAPSGKARRREPDGAAGGDFAWPPPADDPAACSVIMLDDADARPRPATASLADDPTGAFPDIDLETALDAFADSPTTRKALPPTRPPAAPGPQAAPAPTSWWRTAGLRGVVALCIGASLALMPPPGPPPIDAPLQVAPAGTGAPVAPRRPVRTPAGVRLAARSVVAPRPVRVLPRDEDRIRTTLADLRAAYAQLDPRAARAVWPSVDVDALARAFDGLQSQELRFDHCDVTVDGARARAACTGQAIYVPRLGSPASSSAARAWTFELTRTRERWTIASARAS